ncbi:Mg-dependent DNase [Vibrio vulnificus]|uniref:Mg-dependent DNase n=1 Tax=Vibrio vulnificus TaxID=672 RepID=UPI001F03B09D|nr:Mg-dependent DNase [Vibrio vulnificus]EJA3101468.1 Mg-dependent DNase [Vibrio vulnificus]MCG9651825.1 Mg-dependent DNase [Vibrio vulnificus]
MFIKNFRDGFRGKPNFERLELAQYKIDDYFYECSFPNNYSSFVYEMECVSLPISNDAFVNEGHEEIVHLGFVSYRFSNVIKNPLLPCNSQGLLLAIVRIKQVKENIADVESLGRILEKEYVDYYHDQNPDNKSQRGRHTEDMENAYRYANKVWGNVPDSDDDSIEKNDYLLGSYLRSYPQIKCESVKIGKYCYSKYAEGNIDYKNTFRRLYNLPIKDNYILSFEFKYRLEGEASKKKFRKWLLSSDETFEHKILETLDISRLVDASTEHEIVFISSQGEQ